MQLFTFNSTTSRKRNETNKVNMNADHPGEWEIEAWISSSNSWTKRTEKDHIRCTDRAKTTWRLCLYSEGANLCPEEMNTAEGAYYKVLNETE